MDNQLILALNQKIRGNTFYGNLNAETQRNILKEELQYYALNFIYHHPLYSQWTMYGGSALRICHDLDRMSVDLNFEINHPIQGPFLKALKENIEKHFRDSWELGTEQLRIKVTRARGLTLRFLIGNALNVQHASKQIHIKIDLNHFAFKTLEKVIERYPIHHDQLVFVIKGYNMSTLMASKIAAIFLRNERGIGKEVYQEKGRDIYDLLWYMNKKIIPNLSYLEEKEVKIGNLREVFDRLTLKMNQVSDNNLKQDLLPLFTNQSYIENWLSNWRELFLKLKDDYKIRTITTLKKIRWEYYLPIRVYHFLYEYGTVEGEDVKIRCTLSDDWIEFKSLKLPTPDDPHFIHSLKSSGAVVRSFPSDKGIDGKIANIAWLFYNKIERYIEKLNHTFAGDILMTKTIRATANKLIQKEQIVLDASTLINCELEDILK